MGIAVFGVLLLIASFIISGLHQQTSDKVNLRPLAWTGRIVGILMIVIGVFMASVVIVQSGYRGVLLRFGAVQGVLGEGFHLVVPSVNTVEMLEVRTQKEESQATAASRDLQIVTTRLALNYRVDPDKAHEVFRNVGTEYKSRIIDPAVQESLKVVTTQYTAEDLIRLRSKVKAEVEAEITRRLKAYNLLVDPSGLSITNFDFSPEFNRAIEQKQVAQQEAEKQKYVLQQAELEKQTEVARAQGKSQAAKLNAEALKVQGGSLVVAREWIEKWDGKLPEVASGNSGFMLDISSLLKNVSKKE